MTRISFDKDDFDELADIFRSSDEVAAFLKALEPLMSIVGDS